MSDCNIDWLELHEKFKSQLPKSRLARLAEEWEVTPQQLRKLGIGWSAKHLAYTFPERNAKKKIIGIMRRDARTGQKRLIHGSKRGLYLAKDWDSGTGPILVPEGVSDTAALLANGLTAVGRPACKGGIEILADLLGKTDRDIIILGENDKKPDGSWPGRDGARKCAARLAKLVNRNVRWALPPGRSKDAREYLSEGVGHGE